MDVNTEDINGLLQELVVYRKLGSLSDLQQKLKQICLYERLDELG